MLKSKKDYITGNRSSSSPDPLVHTSCNCNVKYLTIFHGNRVTNLTGAPGRAIIQIITL
jgi:hypothetical protein